MKPVIQGLMAAALLGHATIQAQPRDWQIETVDSVGVVGLFSSIALDNIGRPRICSYDCTTDSLTFAWTDGLTWETEEACCVWSTTEYTSLALDLCGYPHIAYRCGSDLSYASRDETGWQIDTIDTVGTVGSYASLMLDDKDVAHISYYDGTNQDLKYARYDGLTPVTVTVDSIGQVGSFTALTLDAFGFPHISYIGGTELKYAHEDLSGWHVEVVNLGSIVDGYTSIDLDLNGYPHIAYYDTSLGSLMYSYWNGAFWSVEPVDASGNAGVFSSMVLDNLDYPHIAYYDGMNGDAKYSRRDSTGWHIEVVDSLGDVGMYVSLAVDFCCAPHISYHDVTNGDLRYAVLTSTCSMTLTWELVGEHLLLIWCPVLQASGYWVYGAANMPSFSPGFGPAYDHRLVVLPDGATMWLSPNTVGDPEENWTYLVMAVDEGEAELARSNRVGAFDFLVEVP